MPDTWTATKKTERDFFFGVLCSIQPDFVEHLIIDCRQQREDVKAARPIPQRRHLNISAEWSTALLREPFTSCEFSLISFLWPRF